MACQGFPGTVASGRQKLGVQLSNDLRGSEEGEARSDVSRNVGTLSADVFQPTERWCHTPRSEGTGERDGLAVRNALHAYFRRPALTDGGHFYVWRLAINWSLAAPNINFPHTSFVCLPADNLSEGRSFSEGGSSVVLCLSFFYFPLSSFFFRLGFRRHRIAIFPLRY